MVDYYNLLQVAPDALPEAIRAAYRREAKRWHPDAHPRAQGAERDAVQRRFILVSQAYDTLSDPARRRDYDRRRGPNPAESRADRGGSGASASQERPRQAGHAAGAGAARPRPERAGATHGAAPEADWNSLLSEVEGLLGKFGLDLKQPAERLLETLLNWARALFDDFLAAWNEEGAQGAPRPGRAGSRTGGSESRKSSSRAQTAGPSRRDRTRTPEIEAELEELKRRAADQKSRGPK
jgi:curved DNA-binding protein CbpA